MSLPSRQEESDHLCIQKNIGIFGVAFRHFVFSFLKLRLKTEFSRFPLRKNVLTPPFVRDRIFTFH